MMHKAWSSIEEVPYCFWRSSVKFQGHTAEKIVNFDLNWAFPDCHSRLNSLMATKWCTKLEVTLKRCPIVFQGHLSNFKVTQAEKLMIESSWRLLGQSQLWNPSDLPCCECIWSIYSIICIPMLGGLAISNSWTLWNGSKNNTTMFT